MRWIMINKINEIDYGIWNKRVGLIWRTMRWRQLDKYVKFLKCTSMSLLRVYARIFLINKTVTALELVKNSNFHASDSPPKPTLLNRDSC